MGYIQLLSDLFRLRGNRRKSNEEIKTWQNRELRRMLRHAWDNSPYYRKTFEERGIGPGDLDSRPLSDFPVIDKDELMEHFDELVTRPGLSQEALRRFDGESSGGEGLFLGEYHVVRSSGSTGIPRYFAYDGDAWDRMLLGIIRAALWDLSLPGIAGLLAGGIRILYIAAVEGRYGGAMAVGDGVDGMRGKRLFIDVNTPLSEWAGRIDSFRPNIIIGYPSALKILAEIAERGEIALRVKRVISCGEPLSPGMRDYLGRIFCRSVVNVYGASESLALGVETAAGEGMHLFDDLNIIEIDRDGIYLTSLYNFAQPLIRYRISDKLLLREESPGPFTRAHVLLSRDEDMLWFRNGAGQEDFLHPLTIEGFCLDGLIDYQFRQTGDNSFEMLAQVPEGKKRPAVSSAMTGQMERILREKGLEFVSFSLSFVDEILPDPGTGKKILILGNNRGGGKE